MDDECSINTAPAWVPGADPNWREHWMPCIFWLPERVPVTAGQEMRLWSNHDDYRLWFDLADAPDPLAPGGDAARCIEQPVCTCGMHLCLDETRVWLLNDDAVAKCVKPSNTLSESPTASSRLLARENSKGPTSHPLVVKAPYLRRCSHCVPLWLLQTTPGRTLTALAAFPRRIQPACGEHPPQ